MTSTIDLERISTDSRGELTYAAAQVLADLDATAKGKCPCHIIASTGMPELLTYELLAELLAMGWVAIEGPEVENPLLKQALPSSKQDPPFREEWMAFFRTIGSSETAPRYFVSLTPSGSRMLSRYRPW